MNFAEEIRHIIDSARTNAVRSVDFCRVQMYWQIGRRIVEEEQDGNARAEYGKYIIRDLSKELTPDYGSGFGVRQLEQARQFYLEYPIANALRAQFNWTQYKLPEDNDTILAAKYQLYLPSEAQLIAEVEKVKSELKNT